MSPRIRPLSPQFSSGPTKKFTGWTPAHVDDAAVGRSHRAKEPKAKILSAIDRMSVLLGLPDDYRLGIVPASDTGAVEMAMWSVLGACGTDILAWESFGKTWVADATEQLKLEDCRILEADWGDLPDLAEVDFSRDVLNDMLDLQSARSILTLAFDALEVDIDCDENFEELDICKYELLKLSIAELLQKSIKVQLFLEN